MKNTKTYSLLVLGGTSSIGLSCARRRLITLLERNYKVKITLLGRDSDKLNTAKTELAALGANVLTIMGDLSLLHTIATIHDQLNIIDEAILTYGSLTNQQKAQTDSIYLEKQLTTNFLSAAVWLEKITEKFEQQGYGNAIIIGSVAGDRGRQSNYIYGAAKAGLETYIEGLQHRVSKQKDINIVLVKPGFVKSPMTAHIMPKSTLLWAEPVNIAVAAEKAVLRGKHKVYAPWFWWWIMKIIRFMPEFIFHRTRL